MGGGLMQLVAYGAQDVYLTGNPQITFFKVIYRRHTNFAVESIEQTFQGSADFGRRVTATLQRNGDLVTNIYLRVLLPGGTTVNSATSPNGVWAWVSKLGHSLINSVELNIGGTSIDKQYGDWLNIWYELARNHNQDRGYAKMIGSTPELTTLAASHDATTLYIPLYFFHCRNDGLALPLIALQYHDVRYDFEFRPLEDLLVTAGFTTSNPGRELGLRFNDASLFVDYVYLDVEERKKFAQASHEYLIEEVQFNGEESVSNNSNKLRLGFNHPVKSLYWGLKLGRYVNPSRTYTFLAYNPSSIESLQLQATKRFVLALAKYTVGNQLDLSNNRLQIASGVSAGLTTLFNAANAAAITTDPDVDNVTILGTVLDLATVSTPISTLLGSASRPTVGDGKLALDVVVQQYDNYGVYINGTTNPVAKALLQLNNHDRFSERDGAYFNYVQPWQSHSNTPADGVNVFSFALNPEEHQPSGTCNFSRIDNATLNLTFGVDGVTDFKTSYLADDSKLAIYAVNYNVLRIMAGMGGLAYSN